MFEARIKFNEVPKDLGEVISRYPAYQESGEGKWTWRSGLGNVDVEIVPESDSACLRVYTERGGLTAQARVSTLALSIGKHYNANVSWI